MLFCTDTEKIYLPQRNMKNGVTSSSPESDILVPCLFTYYGSSATSLNFDLDPYPFTDKGTTSTWTVRSTWYCSNLKAHYPLPSKVRTIRRSAQRQKSYRHSCLGFAEPRGSILKQFGSDQTATNQLSEGLFTQSLNDENTKSLS
jgi:hypothetical protein